jgi:hypothetical protein
MKEIANKMIVCNIHRFLQFLIVEVFYRAKKLIDGDVNDKMILNALIDNGFARITGKTFGNIELIQFVPQVDSVNRLYNFAQKVKTLS